MPSLKTFTFRAFCRHTNPEQCTEVLYSFYQTSLKHASTNRSVSNNIIKLKSWYTRDNIQGLFFLFFNYDKVGVQSAKRQPKKVSFAMQCKWKDVLQNHKTLLWFYKAHICFGMAHVPLQNITISKGYIKDLTQPYFNITVPLGTSSWPLGHALQRLSKWPQQSSDLNPTAHLWRKLECWLPLRPPCLISLPDFTNALSAEWAEIPTALFQNLLESLPRSMNAGKVANGESTFA